MIIVEFNFKLYVYIIFILGSLLFSVGKILEKVQDKKNELLVLL